MNKIKNYTQKEELEEEDGRLDQFMREWDDLLNVHLSWKSISDLLEFEEEDEENITNEKIPTKNHQKQTNNLMERNFNLFSPPKKNKKSVINETNNQSTIFQPTSSSSSSTIPTIQKVIKKIFKINYFSLMIRFFLIDDNPHWRRRRKRKKG